VKYYIIAGEASGDLHGSNLVKNLKMIDDQAEFRGLGGDKMASEGTSITIHYSRMAFMGVYEVLINLKTINQNFRICKEDLLQFKPDALILIDYAGFNLKMARFAREHGIKTLFYISPKVWAWKKSRIKQIKKYIDYLYLILPFEKKYFADRGFITAEYVGNPINDAISAFKKGYQENNRTFIKEQNLSEKPIIALLAGSRKQEIVRLLPEMLKNIKNFPDYQFVIAGAPSIKPELYEPIIKGHDVAIIWDQTCKLLSNARAAIVTSGTATLETALFKVPQAVVYKFQTLSFILVRPFIWIKFFSLVNIIMGKKVVEEILPFTIADKVKKELDKILTDKTYLSSMLKNYDELASLVGKAGSSERTAKHMYQLLSNNHP
jgi:lipid-A-disaccharide synthase